MEINKDRYIYNLSGNKEYLCSNSSINVSKSA